MCPVIRLSDDLYQRLAQHAVGFETPPKTIERILNQMEGVEMTATASHSKGKKITQAMIEKSYELGKAVCSGKIDMGDAIDELKTLGMDSGSARDYFINLKKMLEGKKFTRTMNTATFEYFLTCMQQDYDAKTFAKVLTSAESHVDYYDGLGNGKLRSVRNVIKRFK